MHGSLSALGKTWLSFSTNRERQNKESTWVISLTKITFFNLEMTDSKDRHRPMVDSSGGVEIYTSVNLFDFSSLHAADIIPQEHQRNASSATQAPQQIDFG
jgi:hypothetical protein